MLESERILLNIKMAHKDVVKVGKRQDLDPREKAQILHNLQREIKGYEVDLLVALSKISD